MLDIGTGREMPVRSGAGAVAGPRQTTLAADAAIAGVGLHSGEPAGVRIRPARPGNGIVFRRTDLPEADALVPARWDAVVSTRLCTVLANRAGVSVGTVEHIMAAFAGCGIDNALVDIDGPELPAMDGSAAPFVALIERAGTVEQPAPRRWLRVLATVAVEHGPRRAVLRPADGFSVRCAIAFDSAAVARQEHRYSAHRCSFVREIAPARTFGFAHEVAQLRALGYARGGSLANAVVVDGATILNAEGLRYPDEFARHKVLDAIGDLYLAGGPIRGAFEGIQSGHQLNNELLAALFADPAAWCWTEVGPVDAHVAAMA